MAIRVQTSDDERIVNVFIEGRFVLDSRHDFGAVYKEQKQRGITYRINFSKAEYMDSSGLGMLLMLKEHADANGGTVILCRLSTEFQRIIQVTRFDILFEIEN